MTEPFELEWEESGEATFGIWKRVPVLKVTPCFYWVPDTKGDYKTGMVPVHRSDLKGGPDQYRYVQQHNPENRMTHDTFTLANAADQLGLLKAESALIDKQADEYKAKLIQAASESADRAFDGAMFRATVSFTNRSTTNWTAIIKTIIEASDAETKAWIASLITKHTQTAEGYPVVRVSALKGSV